MTIVVIHGNNNDIIIPDYLIQVARRRIAICGGQGMERRKFEKQKFIPKAQKYLTCNALTER